MYIAMANEGSITNYKKHRVIATYPSGGMVCELFFFFVNYSFILCKAMHLSEILGTSPKYPTDHLIEQTTNNTALLAKKNKKTL